MVHVQSWYFRDVDDDLVMAQPYHSFRQCTTLSTDAVWVGRILHINAGNDLLSFRQQRTANPEVGIRTCEWSTGLGFAYRLGVIERNEKQAAHYRAHLWSNSPSQYNDSHLDETGML